MSAYRPLLLLANPGALRVDRLEPVLRPARPLQTPVQTSFLVSACLETSPPQSSIGNRAVYTRGTRNSCSCFCLFAMDTITSTPTHKWVRSWLKDRLPEVSFLQDHKYSSALQDDDSIDDACSNSVEKQRENNQNDSPRVTTLQASMIGLGIIIIIMELVIYLSIPPPPAHQHVAKPVYTAKPISEWRGCGTTAESARERKCLFDKLTVSWERPDCYHTDLVQGAIHKHEWRFYSDANRTIAEWEEVELGHRTYHAEWNFHVMHCMATWGMMRTALLEKRALADNLLAEEHTRHCLSVAMDRRWKPTDIHTRVHVKWPKCYAYGEWHKANFTE